MLSESSKVSVSRARALSRVVCLWVVVALGAVGVGCSDDTTGEGEGTTQDTGFRPQDTSGSTSSSTGADTGTGAGEDVPTAADGVDAADGLDGVTQGYDTNWITVVKPVGATVTVDGVAIDPSAFQTFGSGQYAFAYVPLTPGVHQAEGDQKFGLSAYGFNSAVSYGYPGGMTTADEL